MNWPDFETKLYAILEHLYEDGMYNPRDMDVVKDNIINLVKEKVDADRVYCRSSGR